MFILLDSFETGKEEREDSPVVNRMLRATHRQVSVVALNDS